MSNSKEHKPDRGWDTYWQGAQHADAYAAGGVSHPAIAGFWDETLAEFLRPREHARVLDIATGSGAVIERLSMSSAYSKCEVTCVDLSEAAIQGVSERFPGIRGVVSDAKSIPLDSGAFDLVTSQFGIEYAGPAALAEAARLLADGGSMTFLMHARPGIIYNECAAARDAVRETTACRFIDLSRNFFEAGFAAVRGADRGAYDRAALELNPAIEAVENILREYGEHVAGDTILRLYSDVQQIHSRIQRYDPDEVLSWLGNMRRELRAYEERMASMCDSSIDANGLDAITRDFREQGLHIVRSAPFMVDGSDLPIAWVLYASRSE